MKTTREVVNVRAQELKAAGMKWNEALKQASAENKAGKLDSNGKLKEEKKAAKKNGAAKKSYYKPVAANENQNLAEQKARYERLRKAIENFDEKVEEAVAGRATVEELEKVERDVLQEALKVLKVAGWYKLYNKEAMAKAIVEAAA